MATTKTKFKQARDEKTHEKFKINSSNFSFKALKEKTINIDRQEIFKEGADWGAAYERERSLVLVKYIKFLKIEWVGKYGITESHPTIQDLDSVLSAYEAEEL